MNKQLIFAKLSVFWWFLRARARISNGNSVLVFITTRYRLEPRWNRDFWCSPYDSI